MRLKFLSLILLPVALFLPLPPLLLRLQLSSSPRVQQKVYVILSFTNSLPTDLKDTVLVLNGSALPELRMRNIR